MRKYKIQKCKTQKFYIEKEEEKQKTQKTANTRTTKVHKKIQKKKEIPKNIKEISNK